MDEFNQFDKNEKNYNNKFEVDFDSIDKDNKVRQSLNTEDLGFKKDDINKDFNIIGLK